MHRPAFTGTQRRTRSAHARPRRTRTLENRLTWHGTSRNRSCGNWNSWLRRRDSTRRRSFVHGTRSGLRHDHARRWRRWRTGRTLSHCWRRGRGRGGRNRCGWRTRRRRDDRRWRRRHRAWSLRRHGRRRHWRGRNCGLLKYRRRNHYWTRRRRRRYWLSRGRRNGRRSGLRNNRRSSWSRRLRDNRRGRGRTNRRCRFLLLLCDGS
jgi:hypothetical protein